MPARIADESRKVSGPHPAAPPAGTSAEPFASTSACSDDGRDAWLPEVLSRSDGPGVTRRQALGALGLMALPWEDLFAQNRVVQPTAVQAETPGSIAGRRGDPAPDLANLHSIMEWMARENSPQLSFLDPQWQSLDAWKQTARRLFIKHLNYQPTPQPLEVEAVQREDRDGFTIEHVNISATAAYRIPTRVLVPAKRRGRLPAVVALHCHGGRYTWGHEKLVSHAGDSRTLVEHRDRYYGRPWAEVLSLRGYVVIVIDAFYFGARRLRVEELDPDRVLAPVRDAAAIAREKPVDSAEWIAAVNDVCSFYEHLTAKTIFAAGSTWPGLHVWDDMRTVDYLASRSDVDPDRIACAGLSLGGTRAAHLIAADPRIKVACVTGWMTVFGQQLRNDLRHHTWMIYIPGLYRSLDLPDFAALHAPGALLVQQCRRDILYPLSAMQAAVDKLTRIYTKAGIAERFRGTFYDEPHSFKPHMQDEALEWLQRWL